MGSGLRKPLRSRSQHVDLGFRRWHCPPGRPRHQSLWLKLALEHEADAAPQALGGAIAADVCIVGGGFTGLWTAIRLREADRSIRVALVEADLCGSGASGRNSGGVGHLWPKLPTLVARLGRDEGLRLINENLKAIDDIAATAERYGIDCELRRGRSAWVATTPAQVGAWQGMLGAAQELGVDPPYRSIPPDELRELFGAGPYYGGVLQEQGVRIQPALLARGLRRVATELGVEIFERSPVRRIAAHPERVAVSTEQGRVDAGQVVLAANAWMAHLPAFRNHVMVVSSDIVATDPIPELLAERGLTGRPGGTNSRMMINYGGLTGDGRVYLGRGGGTLTFAARIGPELDHSPRQAAEVEADFRYLYPELSDVPIAHAWAGAVDRSPSGLPAFGRLPEDDRIHYAIGYTGHGVSASSEAGHILASSVLRRDDEWLELARLYGRAQGGRFPPEPVRFIGGKLVRRAVARKDDAEREGRPVSALDRRLAKLAPATIADLGRRRARASA